jgi:hypothetical protein
MVQFLQVTFTRKGKIKFICVYSFDSQASVASLASASNESTLIAPVIHFHANNEGCSFGFLDGLAVGEGVGLAVGEGVGCLDGKN